MSNKRSDFKRIYKKILSLSSSPSFFLSKCILTTPFQCNCPPVPQTKQTHKAWDSSLPYPTRCTTSNNAGQKQLQGATGDYMRRGIRQGDCRDQPQREDFIPQEENQNL